MHSNTTNPRAVLALAVCGVLAVAVAACGSDSSGSDSSASASSSGGGSKLSGEIAGAGSSAQDAAQQAWIAGFQQKNPDVTISYDPVGSGGGREQFTSGGVPFGGSDAAFADQELAAAQKRCGGKNNLVEVPVYVSPIAIIYNLQGVDNLKLSAQTLAKIFKGDIKTWDDAAIKADNPDAKLPSDRITVVHRSDESGTTENVEDYLSKVAGDTWAYEVSGDWPIKGQEAAEGTSGVVDAVTNGAGTIGYADESQAADLSKAQIKVGSAWVAPGAEGASKLLDVSKSDNSGGTNSFVYELDRTTTEAGAYPIALASYEFACTKYDKAADGKIIKAYLQYLVSTEGQQAAAKNAGSAPLPASVQTKVKPAINAIGGGAAS